MAQPQGSSSAALETSTISLLKNDKSNGTGFTLKPIILTDTNYFRWSQSMRSTFKAQRCWPLPTKENANGEEAKQRLAELYCVILHNVAEHIQSFIYAYEDDPHSAWNALHDKYSGSGIQLVDSLKSALRSLELGSGGVLKLVNDARNLQIQLKGAGKEYDDSDVILDILQALPASYDPVRVNLKAPNVSLVHAEHILTDWERLLKSRNKKEVETALYSKVVKAGPKVCFKCSSPDHFKRQCPIWLAEQRELNNSGQQGQRGGQPRGVQAVAQGSFAHAEPAVIQVGPYRPPHRTRDVVDMAF